MEGLYRTRSQRKELGLPPPLITEIVSSRRRALSESEPELQNSVLSPFVEFQESSFDSLPSASVPFLDVKPMDIESLERFQPGKPPVLYSREPSKIRQYFSRLEGYFILTPASFSKAGKDDEAKAEIELRRVLIAGTGLAEAELAQWFEGNQDSLQEESYESFKAALLSFALPYDFIWKKKKALRLCMQEGQDLGSWMSEMRKQQLEIGGAVMSEKELVGELLFNMDEELSALLRKNPALRTTGYHQADLATLGLCKPSVADLLPAKIGNISYADFEAIALSEWQPIAHRRQQVATQLSRARRATTLPVPPTAVKRTTTTSSVVSSSSPAAAKVLRLSDLERSYLNAYSGCFKCRRINVDHQSRDCPNGFPSTPLQVPAGWKPGKKEETMEARIAKLSVQEMSDPEDEILQSEEEWSDQKCAQLQCTMNGTEALALVDSGCSTMIISRTLASSLNLRLTPLKRPQSVSLALSSDITPSTALRLTHYTFVHLSLSNGLWTPGRTFFKIADTAPPFDLILGNPFIYRHRLTLSFYPEPSIIEPLSEQDLLRPVFGPLPAKESGVWQEYELGDVGCVSLKDLEKAVLARISEFEEQADLERRAKTLWNEYPDMFPSSLPPVKLDSVIPPSELPPAASEIRHRINLIDPAKAPNQRGYACPQRYLEKWRFLLDEHLAAGRIRPSSSPFASPAFIIPKKDEKELPRWINDYRALNKNTVKDRTPLPVIDEVLDICARATVWSKIDMTNAFFQTMMHPEDIEKTAVRTPWGLFEWVVMPMGLCNAPGTHQRRVNEALRGLIGQVCMVYLDDVIIFSSSVEEHEKHVRQVLDALKMAGLFCSPKKTHLFLTQAEFLGHVISRNGLDADPSKVSKIQDWPRPKTVKDLRAFLGLTQYLRKFIDHLANHTAVLTPLFKNTSENSNRRIISAHWQASHQIAFDEIKRIVTSLPCLRTLDYDSDEPVFLMTDASDLGVGAVLLQGPTYQTARPIAFESRQFIPAEKNYPVHEKEMLAIVHALKKWRNMLLGTNFEVLTDHATLKHFDTQRDLSRRQGRWLEVFADYDFTINYIPGEANGAADAMSRHPFHTPSITKEAASVFGLSISSLNEVEVNKIVEAYKDDTSCKKIISNVQDLPGMTLEENGLLHYNNRIVLPDLKELKETLLASAHDSNGHFGARKTFESLSLTFWWERMRQEVEVYVSSCDACQRHKSRTSRKPGQLHPLPVPERPMQHIAIDFVGPLPKSKDFDMLLTITDRLSSYVRLIPTQQKITAEEVAELIYAQWHRSFGLPLVIVCDRDKLFVAALWKALYKRCGVKINCSTAFHPETDGSSERSNKTVIQLLRNMVDRKQTNWLDNLPAVEYAINSNVNSSTGKTPFEVVLGYTPRLLPLPESAPSDLPAVEAIVEKREQAIAEAANSLIIAKARQAEQANKRRAPDPVFSNGQQMMVDSKDRRARYKKKYEKRSTKLFPRWDGPYQIIEARPETCNYKLKLDRSDKSFPTFHVSKLKAYVPNDVSLFPKRQPKRPPPVIIGGEEEFAVERVLEEKKIGRGIRYLVKWIGYPESEASWEPRRELMDTEALAAWERSGSS